jgi:hypothetical protein
MLLALAVLLAAIDPGPANPSRPGPPLATEAELLPFFSGYQATFRLIDPKMGRGAVIDSTVWYFQEIARRIGPQRMQRYVGASGYGNADISGGIDRFWLGNSLRISLDEQLEFLVRLQRGQDLPFRPQHIATVKDLLKLKTTAKGTLRGKTGSDGDSLGWFVGWVEHDGRPFLFATQIRGKDASGAKARGITEQILGKLRPGRLRRRGNSTERWDRSVRRLRSRLRGDVGPREQERRCPAYAQERAREARAHRRDRRLPPQGPIDAHCADERGGDEFARTGQRERLAPRQPAQRQIEHQISGGDVEQR